MFRSSHCSYLVDPASSHTLVLKIKPCMSKCFVILTLDCGRLIGGGGDVGFCIIEITL